MIFRKMSAPSDGALNRHDILFLILRHLPLGVVARVRLVSSSWNRVITHTHAIQLWRRPYLSFAETMLTLNPHYREVAAKYWDSEMALDVARLLSIPYVQRHPGMLVKEGFVTKPQLESLCPVGRTRRVSDRLIYLLVDAGLVALRERLLTVEHLFAMPTFTHFRGLLYSYGLAALREQLITPEQVALMPSGLHVESLLNNPYGLAALRERLITPEQVICMQDDAYVGYLFRNSNGVASLRERLITPEQVMRMPHSSYVEYLFRNPNGIAALREQLITPEQVIRMPDNEYLHFLFVGPNGTTALRERLVTAEQVIAMPRSVDVYYLVGEAGLRALRAKRHKEQEEDVE